MKVMHLLSSLKYTETERGIYAITHACTKAGHTSIVASGAGGDDELVARLTRDGTLHHQLPLPKKSWLALKNTFKLRKLLKQHRPDIVHVHSRTPAWVLYWATRRLANPPKIVATVYGFYPFNTYGRALFNSDVLISASKSIDKYLKEHLIPKQDEYTLDKPNFDIVCVRRGIDIRKYPYRHHSSVHWLQNVFSQYPELEHKKWLMFPTPIGAEYGQDWLIDILGNLQHKFPNIHVIIADDDQFSLSDQDISQEEFIQKLHALNLSDKVTFIGKNPPDIKEWLASSNVVLELTSRPESIGITAIIAIHLGTPVVGWAKGAFADILKATYPQGLVKEETALALCKSIKLHLQNPLRPAMTHEYTIEQMVAETLAVYQSLMPDCKLVGKDKRDKLVCLVKKTKSA